MNESFDEQARSQFIYKLNAMENAAQSGDPFKAGYKAKREAVLAHVADLEVKFHACAQDCVELQSGKDGVWAHFRARGQHFSYCLDNDWMAEKFCDAYRAMLATHKEPTK